MPTEPMRRVKGGRTLVNATAAGALCVPPMSESSFRWMASQGMPASCPAPVAVERDQVTSQKLWWEDEVMAWDKARPGRGNWDGQGAKYRREDIGEAECPTCRQVVKVDDYAEFRRHFVGAGKGRKRCPTGETRAAGFEPTVTDDEPVPA